jgi:hypothetical protein
MAKASPFKRNPRIEYVPKCDRELPPEQRTTFHLSQFDLFDDLAVASEVAASSGADVTEGVEQVVNAVRRVNPATYMRAVLEHGLKGWDNFQMPDGSPAVFKSNPDGTASLESLNLLGSLASEIFAEILEANRVSREQVGKP